MKKIIAIVFSSLFMFSLASAEMGLNIGLSGSMGAFAVTGTEQENDETNKEDAVGAASWGSVFVELRAGDRVTIGVDYLPAALDEQLKVKPVYRTFKGWKTSTKGIRKFNDLPENAKNYVMELEKFIEIKVSSISTSPERNDTILIEDPFNI